MKGASVWEALIGRELPNDPENERLAIGAALLAPQPHARRIAKLARPSAFYDLGREAMWRRIRNYLLERNSSWSDVELARFIKSLEIRRVTEMSAAEINGCIADAFWWHGPYYVGKVNEAATKRERIIAAVKSLRKAMDA